MKFTATVVAAIVAVGVHGCELKDELKVVEGSKTGTFFTHGLSLDWTPQVVGKKGWEGFGDFTGGVEPFAEIVGDDIECWHLVRHDAWPYGEAAYPSDETRVAKLVHQNSVSSRDSFFANYHNLTELENSIRPFLNRTVHGGHSYGHEKIGEVHFKWTNGGEKCLKFTNGFLSALNRLPSTITSDSDTKAYAEFAKRFGWGSPSIMFLGKSDVKVRAETEPAGTFLGSFGSKLENKGDCVDPAPFRLRYEQWEHMRYTNSAYANPLSIRQSAKLATFSKNSFKIFRESRLQQLE